MGLAIAQIQLLTLTARRSDCEFDLSMNSMKKMALTREMSELTSEYYSRLQGKQVSYYANGQYNPVNYSYLMGYGNNYTPLLDRENNILKKEDSMILTDSKGQVVLSSAYANAITSVIGTSAMDANGRGGTFSMHQIPAILESLTGLPKEDFEAVINQEGLNSSHSSNIINTYTGEDTGENTETDTSANSTEGIQKIVEFYLPIFLSAASNGWTTEYNEQMALNDNYVSDAITSGVFQLAQVDGTGNYKVDCSLEYFITSGFVDTSSPMEEKSKITAWYEQQKEIISEKETLDYRKYKHREI